MRGTRAIWAAAALVAGACGGGDGPVDATLDDFTIAMTPAGTERGEVTFDIRNDGALEHEFVILRTDLAADALPSAEGEVLVAEPGIEVVDEVEGIGPEAQASLTVDLEAGAYVMICNIAGHYDQGMHAPFRVT